MKKNSTSSRIIAILLLFSMIIGLAPMKAHANPADPATFDFSSSKIDIVPTGDLTRKGTGVLGIRYNSPNFPSVNNQPGGSYYNIAMTGTNYRAIGLCLNKEKKLDDAARVWSNITPIESFNEPDINGAIMTEVKPYLDFYYYATHSAEGRNKFNWSEKKSVAFTRAVQNILWLNIAGLTSGKTKAEKEEMYIREMQAAIAKLNEGLNSTHANYISNDGMPYNYWQCQDSIQVMASGMVARADGTTIIIPTSGFSYYGATSTTPGQQNVLLPHFTPDTTPNDKWVYIKFQKLDAKTNLPLAGAQFSIYQDGKLKFRRTTTTDEWQIVGPIPIETDTATFDVVETKAPPRYIGTSHGVVTASATANDTPQTAAVVIGSPFKNDKPDNPGGGGGDYIHKKDSKTGEPLAGATFRFVGNGSYMQNGAPFNQRIDASYTTDGTGNLSVKLQWTNPNADNFIPPGTYTVTETVAPYGYTLNNESQTITFNADWEWNPEHGPGSTNALSQDHECVIANLGTDANEHGEYKYTHSGNLTFTNDKKKTVVLLKRSKSNDAPLAGATFEIYKNSTLIGTQTTDALGEIRVDNLETGFYKFVEINAPAGHILPKVQDHSIYVNTEDLTIDEYTIVVYNYDIPNIIITKQDSVTKRKLQGASFDVTIQGTAIGKTYTTGADGTVTIPRDDYKHLMSADQASWVVSATEISAPTDYFNNNAANKTQSITMTRAQGETTINLVFENDPHFEIDIYKYLQGTSTLLNDAKFDVKINGFTLGSFVTDDNGEITIYHGDTHNTIGYGRFLNDHNMENASQWQVEVTEVEPPKGYMLANGTGNTQTLTMNHGEAMKEFNFVNDWYPRVRILKTVYKKVREQSPTFYKN